VGGISVHCVTRQAVLVDLYHSSNCEKNEGDILENLQKNLSVSEVQARPLVHDEDNELLRVQVQEFNQNSLNDENFDTRSLAYVCGYLVKTIKNLDCQTCKDALLTSDLLSHHTFTMFKDDKNRLHYVKKDLIYYIAHVYDLVNIYLKEKGHVKNIFEKMKICLQNNVDFGWFNCQQHWSDVRSN
jgi:hypothetical protein